MQHLILGENEELREIHDGTFHNNVNMETLDLKKTSLTTLRWEAFSCGPVPVSSLFDCMDNRKWPLQLSIEDHISDWICDHKLCWMRQVKYISSASHPFKPSFF